LGTVLYVLWMLLMNSRRSHFWLAGLAATFTGNGIGRFAYITLMPALIQAQWFSRAAAAQLGVATLLGYLLGPCLIQLTAQRWPRRALMRGAMLLCSVSYFACAWPSAPFAWFYGWRFLAGLGGAILMVLAAPMILPHVRSAQRGRMSGLIFSGIGLGAALSGLLIPVLVQVQISWAWWAMGGSCLALTGLTWPTWARLDRLPLPRSVSPTGSDSAPLIETSVWQNPRVWCLLIAYALNAIGFLPHTLFWVDFLVRELGCSLAVGGFSWALFGLGAAIGPVLTGRWGDRWGVRRCLLVGFGLKALGVALPLWSQQIWVLHFSAFLVGMFTPGIVALVSMYAMQLVGVRNHHCAWGAMTFSFALTQAFGGMGMALLIRQMDSYLPLYGISAVALLGSIVCIIAISARSPQGIVISQELD
jgi:predicted MFS family arabinose efflux permease